MLDPDLKEKVELVTGTNNPCGIGAAVARAFAAQGARVFLHYFRWSPTAAANAKSSVDTSPGESSYYSQQIKSIDEVLEHVRESGADVAAFEADLANPALITVPFDRAEAAFGPVEVLVNNAAYLEMLTVPCASICRMSARSCPMVTVASRLGPQCRKQ